MLKGKEINFFSYYFWASDCHVHFRLDTPWMLMTVGVTWLSPSSASLPFCLRLWCPWTWPEPLWLQFIFLKVQPECHCQTNYPKTWLFTGHFPLSEKAQWFPIYCEMKSQSGINHLPKWRHFSISPSLSLFWIVSSNQVSSFTFPFVHLFIH